MDGAAVLTIVKPVWDWLSPVVSLVLADAVSRWMKARRARRCWSLN